MKLSKILSAGLVALALGTFAGAAQATPTIVFDTGHPNGGQ